MIFDDYYDWIAYDWIAYDLLEMIYYDEIEILKRWINPILCNPFCVSIANTE